jgi:serine protease Do
MIWLPLIFALTLSAAPALAQQQQHFHVINRTGQVVSVLNAVRSPRGGENDWGRNLLQRLLPPRGVHSLRTTNAAGCFFDIRMTLADGRQVRLEEQDICTNPVVAPTHAVVVAPGAPPVRARSGSGFVVARDRVLTNRQVVEECTRVQLHTIDGRTLTAAMPAWLDPKRDLALLTVPGDPGPALPFRQSAALRRGEAVVTYGFPFAGQLSTGPSLATGEVNALSGPADNPGMVQIGAPVQPGNSGGPLLDRQGNVVGVVVSRLGAARMAQHAGDVPQSVNFAIKGAEVVEFLRQAGTPPRLAESRGLDRSAAEVGEIAHRSTVLIQCER